MLDSTVSCEADCSKLDILPSSNSKSAYLQYNGNEWSPLYLYRTASDLTLAAIRQSGSEGIGRYDIGKTYGMDTSVKAGNRRVSANIINGIKSFPDCFGQFQKMEGKIRCIKYYWKVAAYPESFNHLFKTWKSVVGDDCPFRIGEVLKFPNTNLNTLRMSDVSLRRLIDIMKVLKERRVVVTIGSFLKIITDMELEQGCRYQIDKKSLVKCLKALEKKGYLHMFETVVVEDFRSNKISVVTEKEITEASHPEVETAIRAVIDEYNEKGRVFPHGQLKTNRKQPEKDGEKLSDLTLEEIEMINNDDFEEMTVDKRLAMLRLQAIRRLSIIYPDQHSQLQKLVGNQPEILCESSDSTNQPKEASQLAAVVESYDSLNENSPSLPLPGSSASGGETSVSGTRLPSDMYGRQSKMIRCFVMHQLVWHCLYGLPEGTKPNVWERFSPSQVARPVPVDQCTVYVDEECPYRFVPPIPRHQDLPRGWFLLQDLINVLPLSIYVLFANFKNKVTEIEFYLKDPILRHMLIADLSSDIRVKLLGDKKAVLQVEHILLTLCGFGLMRLGPTLDTKKGIDAEAQYFYLSSYAYLRDTSTSQKGYSRVSLPIDQYTKYEYVFNTMEDVILYWHHLHAIVQSTPLSFRLEAGPDDARLYKKYTFGMFDRSQIMKSFEDLSTEISPILPHDGCAGFDSSFFVHLRRHWDLNPQPLGVVSWFMSDWRRSYENAKSIVESRVKSHRNTWNSYYRALLPPDSGVFKKSHESVRANPGSLIRKSGFRHSKPSAISNSKKRSFDEVDIISQQHRMHLRNRFTSLERNMLIFIRAVGFFLNPKYRFWLEPVVLRDIMHQNVQESISKTVHSLMAAGVREMKRPESVAYLQRIVKNLASYKEMRVLRNQLAFHPLLDSESRRTFFIDAFNKAKKLLFMESEELPKTDDTDESFEKFLEAGNLNIFAETQKAVTVPSRSQKPKDQNQVRHCVAFNVIVGALISEQDLADTNMESIFEHLGASTVSRILEQLRIDGLITRQRIPTEDLKYGWKGHATLSLNFRNFFNHGYDPDMLEQLTESNRKMESGTTFAADDDSAGTVAAATKCFYSGIALEITMNNDMLEFFESSSQEQMMNITKQLRYLESANLHLEQILIKPEGKGSDFDIPDLHSVLNSLQRTYSLNEIKSTNFEDYLKTQEVSKRQLLRQIHTAIKQSKFSGTSIEDLIISLKSNASIVSSVVRQLEQDSQLITVGVDTIRYVLPAYSDCWLVPFGEKVYVPKPWFTISGEIHLPTVRWIAEGILFSIINHPGCHIDELKRRFAYVLQPRMLLEIVQILEVCSCIRLHKLTAGPMRKKSPFNNEFINLQFHRILIFVMWLKTFLDELEKDIFYVCAAKDAVERFSRIFGTISLPAILKSIQVENI
ncbi:unnamed protein product [Thelazia callipaeda]|uniref:General transcription factor 3C polypeptide 1 n=1 Tax=Thelazia callipaeda TaxID=103827 RepID=A0A158RCN4_THECL|nr:unnamed protein product [Thelazia callipaeda]